MTQRIAVAAPATPPSSKPKGKPKYQKNLIPLQSGTVSVYATPRISKALDEITKDMSLYHGVRLTQVIEAVYTQAKKDGARSVFDEIAKKVREAQKSIPHMNPGKPKKIK